MHIWFVFAGKTEWILAFSGIFLLEYLIVFFLCRKSKRSLCSVWSWSLLAVSIAWLVVGIWESYITEQGNDIRIDVLVVYPLLLIISGVGFALSIGSMVVNLFKPKSNE